MRASETGGGGSSIFPLALRGFYLLCVAGIGELFTVSFLCGLSLFSFLSSFFAVTWVNYQALNTNHMPGWQEGRLLALVCFC